MNTSTFCGRLSLFLLYPAILFTSLLYLYPLLLGCSFPEPNATSSTQCILDSNTSREVSRSLGKAPFRLLALGDPQIEGDSSLPHPDDPVLPHLNALWGHFQYFRFSGGVKTPSIYLKYIFRYDLPRLLWSWRKRLDLWGNDYYLAHIYRTLHWWLQPSHVTVLGDLLGSQWVSDEEFARRSSRFWNTVFRTGRRVSDSISETGTVELLGGDAQWSHRLMNVAGNHDIGYAGDINKHRLDRFELAFGKANWEVKFRLPPQNLTSCHSAEVPVEPELRVVVLNNMILDSPALDPEYQKETYEFIGDRIIANSRPVEDRTGATVLLTHIPLFKRPGVCVDGEFFDYGPHGVKEQNHLSLHASKAILESIYGLSGNPSAPAQGFGRNGVILTGHDHEGCDVLHYMPPETERDETEWNAVKWENSSSILAGPKVPGIRKITVRSMMGSFGGNAGLLSGWFDAELGEWRFEYATCPLGVQHIWWAVHVLDLITFICFGLAVLFKVLEGISLQSTRSIAHTKQHLKVSGSSTLINHANGRAFASGRPQNSSSARHRKPQTSNMNN